MPVTPEKGEDALIFSDVVLEVEEIDDNGDDWLSRKVALLGIAEGEVANSSPQSSNAVDTVVDEPTNNSTATALQNNNNDTNVAANDCTNIANASVTAVLPVDQAIKCNCVVAGR